MHQVSKKHHYIPQFYLRNFTNNEDKFYIYLPQENRYKSGGRLFSPETHFFEKHGNTTTFNDKSDDFLEKDFYGPLDNDIAKLFNKIRFSEEERYGLSEADMPNLQFFVAHLFWRNPVNDFFVKQLISVRGLSGLGMIIKDTVTNQVLKNSQVEKDMIANESTYKVIKYWLPIILFKELLDNDSPLSILKFNVGDKPSLICDNPLIFRNPDSFDVYKDDFILPLSKDKILIRTKKLKSHYENTATVLIDNLLLRQSNQFVSTTDLNYISLLNSINQNSSTTKLRTKLFECFIE